MTIITDITKIDKRSKAIRVRLISITLQAPEQRNPVAAVGEKLTVSASQHATASTELVDTSWAGTLA
jgi:hypothetical protein